MALWPHLVGRIKIDIEWRELEGTREGQSEEEEVNRGHSSNWHSSLPQLSEVPFRRDLSFSGKKCFVRTKGGQRETLSRASRPITRGLLNKVVKLMWDEIRMAFGWDGRD